jgi:Uma2 family endonuclease
MGTPVREQHFTAKEFSLLPDDGKRYELVRGALVCMAATGGQRGIFASRLDHRLRSFVEAHDLGEVCTAETGFRLTENPDTVRAPDVSFITQERIASQGIPEGYWPFAPDLAVEVISPRDRFDEVLTKVQEYLRAGTRLVWVFHPRTKTVTLYRANSEVQLLQGDEELSGEDVVPGFHCRVMEFFG